MCHDAFRYVALIEGVIAGANAVCAVACGCVLGGYHLFQHIGEVLLHQKRAWLRDIAIVEEDVPAAGWEQIELLARSGAVQSLQHVFVVREAELGVMDCRRKNLAQRLGAVAFKHRCQRGDDAGHREGHRRVRARSGGNLVESARLVEVHTRLARRGALSAEGQQVAAARVVEHEDALGKQ